MRRPLLLAALAALTLAVNAAAVFATPVTIHVGAYTGRYFLAPQGGPLSGPYSGDVTLDLAANHYSIDDGASIGGSAFAFDVDASGNVANVSPEASALGGAGSLTLNNATITINAGSYGGRYFLSSIGTGTALHGNNNVVLIPGLSYTLDNGSETGTLTFSSDFIFTVTDASGTIVVNSPAATATGSTLSLVTVPVIVNPQAYTGVYFVSSYEPTGFSGTQTFNVMPGLRYALDDGAHLGGSGLGFNVDASGTVATDAGPATASGNTITLLNLFVTIDPGCFTGTYRVSGYGDLQGAATVVLIPTLVSSILAGSAFVQFTPHPGVTTVPGLSCFTLTITQASPYTAQIQPPIKADGSSVFNANRGVVPVKFTLTYNGAATCQLPAAAISLVQTGGSTPGVVNQSDYVQPSDNGTNFRIDSANCQYVYNLGTSGLGAGTYVAQISISGIVVGHGTFGIK